MTTALRQAVRNHPATIKAKLPRKKPDRHLTYTVSQLLETYKDPRAILLEIASMTIDQLVELAKCTPLEALQEKRLCATNVLPYVVQKLPISVDMRHTKAIHLNIVDQREYEALVVTATSDEQPMQLITGATVTESDATPDAQQEGETDVGPSVAAAISSSDEPGQQT